MSGSPDERIDELANLKQQIRLAELQLDAIEARANLRKRPIAAVDIEQPVDLAVDPENRLASLVAIGLSQLPSRIR